MMMKNSLKSTLNNALKSRQGLGRVSFIGKRFQSTQTQYNENVKFTTSGNQKHKNNDNVNAMKKFLIFSGCFGLGWFITQHFTFMDLVAMYKYDELPETDSKVVEYKNQLRAKLANLPITRHLETHGYMKTYDSGSGSGSGSLSLIDKTLHVPGGIFIDPEVYYNHRENQVCGIYHLGMKLTGYPFIVHGGILATVMEDMMVKALRFETTTPEKNARKIASLQKISLKYKFPTLANQFVVIRSVSLKKITDKVYEIEMDLMDQSGKRTLVSGKGKFSVST